MTNRFNKEFYIVNENKANVCYTIYEDFLNFDINKLSEFLPTVKNAQVAIHSYKGAFYCALCDAHQQKYINIAKK